MAAHALIDALRPADTPAYMTDAWVACLVWAIGQDDILAKFRSDTGNQWTPPRDGLSKMIDAATGADVAFLTQFIQWANVNIWGPINGPVGDGDIDETIDGESIAMNATHFKATLLSIQMHRVEIGMLNAALALATLAPEHHNAFTTFKTWMERDRRIVLSRKQFRYLAAFAPIPCWWCDKPAIFIAGRAGGCRAHRAQVLRVQSENLNYLGTADAANENQRRNTDYDAAAINHQNARRHAKFS